MTTRERKQRRRDRRLEWAEGRDSKAAALLKQNEPYQGDVAFNTQPGHIPERARAIARSDRAYEHHNMAHHHRSKAAGIDAQLNRSIFSDDPDAPERLRERIAELEAQRARVVAYNKTARKAGKAGEPHGDLTVLDEKQRGDLLVLLRVGMAGPGLAVPGYVLANLGGNIRRLRQRLAQAERAAECLREG